MITFSSALERSNKIVCFSMEQALDFLILPLVQSTSEQDPINVELIQSICSKGLDECPPEDRVIAWLVLSGIYPKQPEDWPDVKTMRIAQYKDFISLFEMEGYEKRIIPNTTDLFDYGIPKSDLMEIIHGDVIRTSHHIIFLPYPDRTIKSEDPEDILLPYHEQMRRLERILYIFACVNPTLSYVQGFNEICCVIYYAFSLGLPYFAGDFLAMEAFVFYTFQQLFAVTQISELFTTQDKSSLIHNQMKLFMEVLKRHLPNVANIINGLGIHPLCFCYRWLNLMFAQDYLMPNLLMIWDALFAHFNELIDYEKYVSVAQMKMIKNQIDNNDYVGTITALQRIEIEDVKLLLVYANQYWNEDHQEKKSIFTEIFNFFK
ncbi:TBC1 domain protein [Histomonas meleagridis]|uniref:TBC1 domain protein n=1 Tax=Histomonas meleagridis TaxID=135588 RepID=UPI0035599DEC|nr:TBC1 domain protein [Histomonas meleagridis]KAH0804003.1 TBC1 domain protein [Histomonas meleagridis]